MNRAYDNILDTIGNTPLIKLNKTPLSEDIKCQMFAKCEYFNPGGSMKDRIGFNMIAKALKEGKIKEGGYVIEATGGNTGIGIALACVCLNLKAVFAVHGNTSLEKISILKSLGAEVHICDPLKKEDEPGK